MSLIKTLHKLKTQFLIKLSGNETYKKSIYSFCLFLFLSALIWVAGPHFIAAFSQPEKRIYAISFLFLLWFLKLLVLDIEKPPLFQFKDKTAQKNILELPQRFQGALAFLKKTTASKHNVPIHLNQLPWYLLVGPTDAGKTTLLANSGINFILQRRLPQQNTRMDASEHCDWWITQNACILDIPSKYLIQHPTYSKEAPSSSIWQYLLYLIKKYRGKMGIHGIIIALPLPELMAANNNKSYQTLISQLSHAIQEIQNYFPGPLSCQLLLTKCDLLPGFIEFFAESTKEEITQAWGITLPERYSKDKTSELFSEYFDNLIKKLNQQLISRLHQERNPFARPYIKDFPLQVERLKKFTADFIKLFFTSKLNISLQGVYLSSAHQSQKESEAHTGNPGETAQQTVQLFKQPSLVSHAYFIKKFISHGLLNPPGELSSATKNQPLWMQRTLYAGSAGAVILALVLLGSDFEKGVHKTYDLQNTLADYQVKVQGIHNADERLLRTLSLLTTLNPQPLPAWSLRRLLKRYTQQSDQEAALIYQQTLKTILIPEIKNYLGDCLKNPVNRNLDDLYTILKAYLMLGDASQFQAEFIEYALSKVLPKSFNTEDLTHLMGHINAAFGADWHPANLDTHLVEEARKYLTAIPSLQRSLAILKNMYSNNRESKINLGVNAENDSILISSPLLNQIPTMFTAKEFSAIYLQEIPIAAEEALKGNWVLGSNPSNTINPEATTVLINQLRSTYVNNYIDLWESLLADVHLSNAKDLKQTNRIISSLSSKESPLLQFLQTLHDNTYFEPITSISPKLQNLGALIDENGKAQTILYQVFMGLQSLQKFIQTILIANNGNKIAFDIISNRMQNQGSPDAITQLRLIAATSPEPIKTWLEKIADDTWHFIMGEAVRYIDISWQKQVLDLSEQEVAKFYSSHPDSKKPSPFLAQTKNAVNFYHTYLVPFIDTTSPSWHWNKIDNAPVPFNKIILEQIQQALLTPHETLTPPESRKNEMIQKQALRNFSPKFAMKHNITAKQNRHPFTALNLQNFHFLKEVNDEEDRA